jgi:hypothetical protein
VITGVGLTGDRAGKESLWHVLPSSYVCLEMAWGLMWPSQGLEV